MNPPIDIQSPPLSLVCLWNTPRGREVSSSSEPRGSFGGVTFSQLFASDYRMFSSDDRFMEFNGEWVFGDLLLHEMELFLLD